MRTLRILCGTMIILMGLGLAVLSIMVSVSTWMHIEGAAAALAAVIGGICLIRGKRNFAEYLWFISSWS